MAPERAPLSPGRVVQDNHLRHEGLCVRRGVVRRLGGDHSSVQILGGDRVPEAHGDDVAVLCLGDFRTILANGAHLADLARRREEQLRPALQVAGIDPARDDGAHILVLAIGNPNGFSAGRLMGPMESNTSAAGLPLYPAVSADFATKGL